jgi:hypothetical protein
MSRTTGSDAGRARLPRRVLAGGLWAAGASILYVLAARPLEEGWRGLLLVPQDLLAALLRLGTAGVADLAALGLGLLAAVGAGSLVIGLLGKEVAGELPGTLAPSLGLGVLAYLTFFLGLAGGYTPTGAVAATAVLVLLALAGARALLRGLRDAPAGAPGGAPRALFFAAWAAVAVFLLAKATRPAVFYDAVTYHLGVPNFYLQEGRIGYLPFDAMSNNPFLMEMLYTLGMFLAGLHTAQMASVAVFLLLALAVRDFSRRFVPGVDPHLPALLFVLTPAFIEISVLFTNDLLLACFLLQTLHCVLRWRERGGTALLVLGGAFAGCALGVKYHALLYLPALVLVGAWPAADAGRGRWAATLRAVGLLTGVALLVWAPWPVKNALATGNPLYPVFSPLFGSSDMSAPQYARIVDLRGGRNLPLGLVEPLWRLLFGEAGAVNARYGAAAGLGPVLAVFVPALLCLGGIPHAARRLLLIGGATYLLWAATAPEARYLYPAVVLLTIVAGIAAGRLLGETPRGWGLAAGALTGLLLLGNLGLGFRQVDRWTSAAGFSHLRETDEEYLSRRMQEKGGFILAAYGVEELASRELPADATVLIVGDAQHLYLRRRHRYTYLSATTPYRAFEDGSATDEQLAARLRAEGVTHVVFNPRELARLQQSRTIGFAPGHNRRVEAFLGGPCVRLLASTNVNGWPVFLFELR